MLLCLYGALYPNFYSTFIIACKKSGRWLSDAHCMNNEFERITTKTGNSELKLQIENRSEGKYCSRDIERKTAYV